MKVFQESEVRSLAYGKVAVLEGVEEGNDVELLERGREILEGENGKEKEVES
jgi:hypothetical protein